jgi:hypothetical protein
MRDPRLLTEGIGKAETPRCHFGANIENTHICVAMYLRVAEIQNIANTVFSRHKPDTSGRSNASTPDSSSAAHGGHGRRKQVAS